jgi:hypothetical protein
MVTYNDPVYHLLPSLDMDKDTRQQGASEAAELPCAPHRELANRPNHLFSRYLFCIPSLESWQHETDGFDAYAALLEHVSKGDSQVAQIAFRSEIRYWMGMIEGYFGFGPGMSREESLEKYLASIKPFGARKQHFIYPEVLVARPVPYERLSLVDLIKV